MKTASSKPLYALAREMVYTVFKLNMGVKRMTNIFNNAKSLGLVKNQKDFHKWIVNECFKFLGTIEVWLDKQITENKGKIISNNSNDSTDLK
jgi:hypothetical protein